MKADKIENWSFVDGDNALFKAVEKQNKWTRKNNSTLLDYQRNQLVQALKFVKQFRTAVDAGANYGLMSYHLNSLFEKVHAFEIDNKISTCLIENVKRFNLTRVKVYKYGLGDIEKNVDLMFSKNSFATRIDPGKVEGSYQIKTIDSLNFTSCDFIKIDCEGYEPHIIRGGEQTIRSFTPVILMEDKNLSTTYGEDGQNSVKILQSWGYKKVVQFKKDCIMTYDR